jgi:hypothetical protein
MIAHLLTKSALKKQHLKNLMTVMHLGLMSWALRAVLILWHLLYSGSLQTKIRLNSKSNTGAGTWNRIQADMDPQQPQFSSSSFTW